MNGYFIHTIELSKNISYEEFENIKNTMHCFPKNKGSKVPVINHQELLLIFASVQIKKCTVVIMTVVIIWS